MTGTLGHSDFIHGIADMLRRAGAFMGRAGFGIFLAVAAVIALLATTVIGVTLLIAVVFLGFARGNGRKVAARREARPDQRPETLETRRTPDGWVIEPYGR
jgi:hypothetical protein